ncbi:hypothetical protein BOTCAL_0604g00010 [Botryotinia calthae]|uniref:Uncharacterized protein n=1 Tax=Botryotinia calthae TaxID=38488 RepID=A0A4Y8CLE3_9HELO|nr:hypothetical protein BOTCAL_0604g00010 [Botryotinia calthae]
MMQPWSRSEADEAQFPTVSYSTRIHAPYNGTELEVYDKSRPIQIDGKRIFGVLRKTVVMVASVFLMVVCVVIGIGVGVSSSKGNHTSQSEVVPSSSTATVNSMISPTETTIIPSATNSQLLATAPTGS